MFVEQERLWKRVVVMIVEGGEGEAFRKGRGCGVWKGVVMRIVEGGRTRRLEKEEAV
jgi:hypothetical protein